MTNHDPNVHRATEEAMDASELRYRRLIKTAKDRILFLDAETGIVKQNNSFISVCSEPGKGSTFRIHLADGIADVEGAVVAKAPRGHGETILLVEDEEPMRAMCGLFLAAMGYDVVAAESPVNAVEIAGGHAKPIRVLLTDVIMPGMDGGQLARRVCGIDPNVKVLFMSGYPADVIAQHGLFDRNMAFIAKPFTRNELAQKLCEVLDGG